VARYTVKSLKVGALTLTDVPVLIERDPGGASVLGLDFVRRLDSLEIRDGRMHLHWRDPAPPATTPGPAPAPTPAATGPAVKA
jgi:hypothetical protein